MPLSTIDSTGLSSPLTGATLSGPTISGAVVSTMASSVITSGTAVASTSGTSIDFTGLPSWIKRITVLFQSVSTGTASNPPLAFLLGTSGGFASSGYLTSTGSISGAGAVNTVSNITTNFQFIQPSSAANSAHGKIVFENISGNIWVGTGSLAQSDVGRLSWVTGSITLSGVLDRVRMTTVGGTDTFDAGSINIQYE